jgi:hypothetical protein
LRRGRSRENLATVVSSPVVLGKKKCNRRDRVIRCHIAAPCSYAKVSKSKQTLVIKWKKNQPVPYAPREETDEIRDESNLEQELKRTIEPQSTSILQSKALAPLIVLVGNINRSMLCFFVSIGEKL